MQIFDTADWGNDFFEELYKREGLTMHACSCVGRQNNEPFCPCMMREKGVFKRDGSWVIPERTLSDVLEITKKSGFEPIPKKDICNHPEHNPPMNLCIPHDQQYRHVCQVVCRGSQVSF